MRELFSKNNFLSCFFLLVIILGCNTKKPADYMSWYKDVKPVTETVNKINCEWIEQPAEVALCAVYGNNLNKQMLDSFNRNEIKNPFIQIRLELKKDSSVVDQKNKLTGFEGSAFLDENPVQDVIQENTGVADGVLRFIITVKKANIKTQSKLIFIHPLLGDKPLITDINNLIIKNKKKLTL